MARIEVLLSDDIDELLRKRADADGDDDESLREGFAKFARDYPSIRQELFEDDPDLSLDAPFESDVDHDEPITSSMSKRAFTGHLTDRHVYAMAVPADELGPRT
ncbi:MAG: hypothetical protein OXH86_13625 [Acidimicrobiaceae bacterium]|nr:hypothetical protein [Acidimicrobiaceae bacterium]